MNRNKEENEEEGEERERESLFKIFLTVAFKNFFV